MLKLARQFITSILFGETSLSWGATLQISIYIEVQGNRNVRKTMIAPNIGAGNF